MRSAEVEAWVQRVAERTAAGGQNEDTRVELKSSWVPADEAAWRLGGHANAAGGEPILWVIGLAPDGKVVPTKHEELANWWPQVVKSFDDAIAPEMLSDVVVKLPGGDVVALVFGTERAPFVIKGGSDNTRVPFRVGTRCNGVRRSALVRMLAPSTRLPTVELLYARLVHFAHDPKLVKVHPPGLQAGLRLIGRLYVVPANGTVHFPAHRQRVRYKLGAMKIGGLPTIESDDVPSDAAASFTRPGWLGFRFDVGLPRGPITEWRDASSVTGELLMHAEGVATEIVMPFNLHSALMPFQPPLIDPKVAELKAWTMNYAGHSEAATPDMAWVLASDVDTAK